MNLDTLQVVFVFNWILFIGLIPLSIFWIRRGLKIWLKKDYSFVALWKGRSPDNAKKYVLYAICSNLSAGIIFLTVFFLVLILGLEYEIWTAIVGVTFWMKILIDFNVSMYAHKVGIFSLRKK
ncbi:MAG: hypothetical protein ACOC34_01355 [Thermotogota bacterium]